MTRKEEIKHLREFIEKNGVKKMPPDTRTESDFKNINKKPKKRRTLRAIKKK